MALTPGLPFKANCEFLAGGFLCAGDGLAGGSGCVFAAGSVG
jgi:hypothetical protein